VKEIRYKNQYTRLGVWVGIRPADLAQSRKTMYKKILKTVVIAAFAISAWHLPPIIVGQTPAFTLGQILKAASTIAQLPVPQKNTALARLLIDIQTRKVAFPLTREYELLLRNDGLNNEAIEVIRKNSQPIILPKPTPSPTPRPSDAESYRKNADELSANGSFALALADYDRAVELNDRSTISTLLNRGKALHSFGSFEKAVSDFDRVIDLDPTNSAAFFHRAASYEKLNNLQEALAGFRRASELDGSNALARSELDRIQALLVRPAPTDASGKTPAPRLMEQAKADYPAIARNSKIEGKVLVEVEVDERGRVIDAKAIDGHNALRRSAVNAAKKSKFQAANDGTKAIKGKVVIEFNFKI
jgi:TonB family protein